MSDNKSRAAGPPHIVLYVTSDEWSPLLDEHLTSGVVNAEQFFEQPDVGGMPLFMLAVTSKKPDVVRVLLKHAPSENSVDVTERNAGYTALVFAALKGDCEIAEILLSHGANPKHVGKFGQSVVDVTLATLRDNSTDMINLLKKYIASPANNREAVDAARNPGAATTSAVNRMQFMSYVCAGNINAMDQLGDLVVGTGFLDATDERGLTFLHYAATASQLGALQWLVDTGKVSLDSRGPRGETALHSSVLAGGWGAANFLIEHGCDLGITAFDNRTPFTLALGAFNSDPTLSLMIRKCTGGKISTRAELGPLIADLLAEQTNDSEDTIRSLVRSQIVTIGGGQIMTSAVQAAQRIDLGDAILPGGVVPLHFCAGNDLLKSLALLVELGGPGLIQSRDHSGATALHVAIRNKKLAALKQLLDAALQPSAGLFSLLDVRDQSGESVADCAIRSGNPEIVALLSTAWQRRGGGGGVGAGSSGNTSGSNSGGFSIIGSSNLSGTNGSNSSTSGGGAAGLAAATSSSSGSFNSGGGGGGSGMYAASASLMMMSSASSPASLGSTIFDFGPEAASVFARIPRTCVFDSDDVQVSDVVLGRGGGGQVRLATIKSLGKVVAAKFILDPSDAVGALKECEIGLKLHHPRIIQTLGVALIKQQQQQQNQQQHQSKSVIVILLQLADGTLYSLLTSDQLKLRGGFSFEVAGRLMREMTEAIGYLHTKGIVMRDVKPHNFLLSGVSSSSSSGSSASSSADPGQNVHVMLSDFGITRQLSSQHADSTNVTNAGVGTLRYSSKSQLHNATAKKVDDVYALGCIFFWLLGGVEPWMGASMMQIVSGDLLDTFKPREGAPEKLVAVTKLCLSPKEEERPRDGKELMQLLLDDGEEMPAALVSGGGGMAAMIASSSNGGDDSKHSAEQQQQQELPDATEQFDADMTWD